MSRERGHPTVQSEFSTSTGDPPDSAGPFTTRVAVLAQPEGWMMMISAGQGKATGPGHFVLCGQGDLQEAERLQFTGTAEGA